MVLLSQLVEGHESYKRCSWEKIGLGDAFRRYRAIVFTRNEILIEQLRSNTTDMR
jgi:hypothetical protein